jgi:GTP-binding protein HflX
MASISHALNRRVGVLLDRAGRVEAVSVGEAHRLSVPRQPSAPSGRLRFCTLRFIATQFEDDDPSTADLASIALHRLDVMAVISVAKDGHAGPVRVAHLIPAPARVGSASDEERATRRPEPAALPRGFARARPVRRRRPRRESRDIEADGERYRLWPPRPAARIEENFLELIRALEQEFDRHLPRVKRARSSGRAILVHVTTGPRSRAEASMDELAELAESAELDVVERVVQRRAAFDPKTLMGSGKLQDLIIHALRLQADFIVVDQNLTPAQARAIAEATDLKVIDRTQLILDIFAERARTHEGKIQVELAQLNYLLPRLMKRGDSGLSRLEGGIGGRGPGEQKLEIDRRRVRDRIRGLERRLGAERKRREQRRARRRQRDVPVISLVGYTNAGKSTLLNHLTRSEVFVENRMFATLDPTTRRLRLPRDREVVVNDTVGFIRDLPPDLIAAFRATLEEIEDSDLIVHMVDVSHPDYEAQIRAVQRILDELDYGEIPQLLVFNKTDRLDALELAERVNGRDVVTISALRAEGIDALLERIDFVLPSSVRAQIH